MSGNRLKREARLRWLDSEIRANRYPSPARMALELGISERTAYSDCAYLRDDMNAPVAFDAEQGGWYYTDPTFSLPLIQLTDEEASALRRALLIAREYLGDTDTAPLRQLTEQIARFVPDVIPTGRESVGGSLHAVTSPPEHSGSMTIGLLSECEKAIKRRRKLRLLYHGAHRDRTTERTVRPYHLHNDRGEWYLIAHCELRNGQRTFLLSRVHQWHLLPEDAAFARPKDFDGEALVSQGFHLMHGSSSGGYNPVTVVIRFSPYQARWIRERIYHPTQRVQHQEDGSILLTLQVAGLADVKRWVLAFGPEAEVLKPVGLREEIAADIARLQEIYG